MLRVHTANSLAFLSFSRFHINQSHSSSSGRTPKQDWLSEMTIFDVRND
jgi:hypothetical protein